ncbi:HipA family kinase, partial [Citrobacter freundii]|uniref:HipA family kinase n=1 Tax=Citrobacter freundii TaxID=546 RepID=UPI0013D0790C
VVKLRGAGQGPKVLVAELLAGELARAVGLPVPELSTVHLDAAFGQTERDPEIQDLLRASEGLNVGLAF